MAQSITPSGRWRRSFTTLPLTPAHRTLVWAGKRQVFHADWTRSWLVRK
jgi:hypothetical protein